MIHRRTLMMSTIGLAVALLAACGGGGDDVPAPPPTAQAALANQLYTQTNAINNTVLQFSRAADGTLTRLASVAGRGQLTKVTEAVIGSTSKLGLQGLAGI